MIEDKSVRLDDQTRWDLYVKRIGEPNRWEDWKPRAIVYGTFLFFAVMGGVSLWLFLTGRVG